MREMIVGLLMAGVLMAGVLMVCVTWSQPLGALAPEPAPAREVPCRAVEGDMGWVPLRCGNYQGYTSGWWYADWMK